MAIAVTRGHCDHAFVKRSFENCRVRLKRRLHAADWRGRLIADAL